MTDDRHNRRRTPVTDRLRRPPDGYRARSSDRFDRLVDDAMSQVPAALLAQVDNVAIVVEDVPPPGEGVLLGLYEGVPRTDRGFDAPLLPDRITLFRRPLELRARSKEELKTVIAETIIHEIAHHFGIDDDRLDDLGWG
ncbi:MAG: metallopeptidase family protein [Nitriliruptorales bacterium]|nr:metallopeptidase family protein [Nitriliruptorales bacterium]